MARKVLITFGAVFALLVVIIASRPSKVVTERSLPISAPRELVFSYLDDFHGWAQWSPWEKLDPAMKRTFEGPESGVGAKYTWAGNDTVGEGHLTVTAEKPNESVSVTAEFVRPFPGTSPVTLETATVGDATVVTWRVETTNGFMGKAMALVMDMEKSLGGDLEKGLGELKFVAEAEAARRAPPVPPPPGPTPEGADAGPVEAPDAGR